MAFRLGASGTPSNQVPAATPAALSSSEPGTGAPPAEMVVAASLEGRAIVDTVIERIDTQAVPADRVALSTLVRGLVEGIAAERKSRLTAAELAKLVEEICGDMTGLGPLEPLLADDGISEIMIGGPNRIWIERSGRRILSGVRFRDEPHLRSIAARIARTVGRRVDDTSPIVDCRLLDGSRVNIVLHPLALDGTSVTIRKFPKKSLDIEALVRLGALTRRMAEFLRYAVASGCNIIISGGTGSGKTTLLNAISAFIPENERILTVEDAAELRLQQNHVERFETRPGSIEAGGSKAVTVRDLVAATLRKAPTRIIIGECRGGEAFDMLQAMNTGHDGSMTSLHSNGVREAMARLESLVLMGTDLPLTAVRYQISSAVDLVVQIARGPDHKRRVIEIAEVSGVEGDTISMMSLFRYAGGGMEPPKGGIPEDGYYRFPHRPSVLRKAGERNLAGKMAEALGLGVR